MDIKDYVYGIGNSVCITDSVRINAHAAYVLGVGFLFHTIFFYPPCFAAVSVLNDECVCVSHSEVMELDSLRYIRLLYVIEAR